MNLIKLILITATITAICSAGATKLQKNELKSRYLSAVCNDGSTAVYYFKASPTKSTTWVLYLQGGGFCFDDKSCL